jgi:hypothetical protein
LPKSSVRIAANPPAAVATRYKKNRARAGEDRKKALKTAIPPDFRRPPAIWHSPCTSLSARFENKGELIMAMARFSVMYFGHFILFSFFLLFYALLIVGLITRLVKRSMADVRQSH